MKNQKMTAALLIAPLLLGACSGKMRNMLSPNAETSQQNQQSPVQPSFSRFPDLPMPVKAKLDMGKTLIFGTNDEWIGRLVVSASHSSNDMFDFYKQEMPGFGWQEITSIRSDTSVMTYTRGERVATIQIEDSALRGANVTVTVSPRGAQEFPPPAADVIPPAQ
ncbi:MAG: hypothetical protein HQ504_07160 [Rhodospirillaceae bacterium]|nr:hypothetical protein [Rhodospirillaceae bacterium]